MKHVINFILLFQVLCDTGIHHLRLLFVLGRLALFLFLPVWAICDLKNLIAESLSTESISYKVLGLLLLDGTLNWIQNIVAFSVMSIVTPLTYAVANASKRIFVIAVTLFILGNPVTGLNIFGMTLAILGVFCYNKAKYDQRQSQKKASLLPRYSDLNKNGGTTFQHNGWVPDTHRLLAI